MGTFGPAYSQEKDEPALTDQRNRIRAYMADHRWRPLFEISETLHYPEASISAQLRHLRKEQFGSYRIEKRRVDGMRLWEYRMLDPLPKGQLDLLLESIETL